MPSTLDTPRDPGTWPVADPRPVPEYIQDALVLGQTTQFPLLHPGPVRPGAGELHRPR